MLGFYLQLLFALKVFNQVLEVDVSHLTEKRQEAGHVFSLTGSDIREGQEGGPCEGSSGRDRQEVMEAEESAVFEPLPAYLCFYCLLRL